MKKISTIISIVIGLSIIGSGIFGAITYFAPAEAVEKLSERLDNKIIQDKIDALQVQIWKIQDRFPHPDQMPQGASQQLRWLIDQKDKLEKELYGK